MTYYDILEIDKNASINQIKKSYYRLALKYHPDKSNSEESKCIFQSISEAYQILSDPIKKIDYDKNLVEYENDKKMYYPTDNFLNNIDFDNLDIRELKNNIDILVDNYLDKYNIPPLVRIKVKNFIEEIKNGINDDDTLEIIIQKLLNHPKIKLFSSIFNNVFSSTISKIVEHLKNKLTERLNEKSIDIKIQELEKNKNKDKNQYICDFFVYELDINDYCDKPENEFLINIENKNKMTNLKLIVKNYKENIEHECYKIIDIKIEEETEYILSVKNKTFIIFINGLWM